MFVTVFRSRLRPGVDAASLESLGARMYELAASMPGFISYKDYLAADGESVALVEFEDADSLLAWRQHPEHLAAQQLGRSTYFADYRIQVCEVRRQYAFDATSGRTPESG